MADRCKAGRGVSLQDEGCSEDFLAEDFAAMEFKAHGIDPSAMSIETAKGLALEMGLAINYRTGRESDSVSR